MVIARVSPHSHQPPGRTSGVPWLTSLVLHSLGLTVTAALYVSQPAVVSVADAPRHGPAVLTAELAAPPEAHHELADGELLPWPALRSESIVESQPVMDSPDQELKEVEKTLAEMNDRHREAMAKLHPAQPFHEFNRFPSPDLPSTPIQTAHRPIHPPSEPPAIAEAPPPAPSSSAPEPPIAITAGQLLEFAMPASLVGRWHGTLEARIELGADGKALSAVITHGTGVDRWDRQIESALLRASYRPASRGEIAVASVLVQELVIR